MSDHPLPLLVEAVILMARRQCNAIDCGAEAKLPGSKFRHLRCSNCPLEDIDRMVDVLASKPN